MMRGEANLRAGADRLWPGTADDLVAVYAALNCREHGLWATMTIRVLLTMAQERVSCLAALRRRIPRASRRGPKRDREEAAMAALDRLAAIADMEAE